MSLKVGWELSAECLLTSRTPSERSGAVGAQYQRDAWPGLDGQIALRDDNGGQQPVGQGGDLAEVAAGGGFPPYRHGRAEEDVPAPHLFYGQARLLDKAAQLGPAVPAPVPDRVVVRGPEGHVARHRDQGCPARL